MGKYLVTQVPGWILAAGGLWLLRHWFDLSLWVVAGLLLALVLKDLALYPFLRCVYSAGSETGTARLVGAEGIAEEPLAPSGYIRLGGERWRAEALREDGPIPAGRRVRVQAVRGLTLLIEPTE